MLLVTGFEPFDGRDINPARELARALDGSAVAGRAVHGRVLPVAFARTAAAVAALVAERPWSAILMTGLSGGETALRIEQFAINAVHSRRPDNDGRTIESQAIDPAGPMGRRATLDAAAMERRLRERGIPARLSFHAGTHCCNLSLYTALGVLERSRRAIPCGFLHLPLLPEQAVASTDALPPPSLPLEVMVAGARSILEAMAGEPA